MFGRFINSQQLDLTSSIAKYTPTNTCVYLGKYCGNLYIWKTGELYHSVQSIANFLGTWC